MDKNIMLLAVAGLLTFSALVLTPIAIFHSEKMAFIKAGYHLQPFPGSQGTYWTNRD